MGVSTATITNALNRRPNVSEKKRVEIIKKANELGYKPNLHARAMVKNGIKIGVVLAKEPREFNDYLRRGIRNAVEKYSDYKVRISEHSFHDNRASLEVRDALLATFDDEIDGLILFQSFYPDAYIDILKDYVDKNKLPVIYYNHSSFFDTVPDIARISTNPKVIGKIVSQLLRIALGENGVVGVITTSKQYDAHREIVETFSRQCTAEGLRMIAVMENHDDKAKTYDCTYKLLKDFPEIRAIYITSFDSIPVCRCVEYMNLKDKIWVVGHDIYPEMVKYLQEGPLLASIFQNPILIGTTGMELLIDNILGEQQKCGDVFIQPQLVLRSNLECFTGYI